MDAHSPKWGIVMLWVVQTCPWTSSSRWNSLGTWGQRLQKGVPLSKSSIPPAHLWRCNPDMTALKWACLQVFVVLANSHFVITFMALLIILELTTAGTFSAYVKVSMNSIKMSSLYPLMPGICKLTSTYPNMEWLLHPYPQVLTNYPGVDL